MKTAKTGSTGHPRSLGAAFLTVIATSLLMGLVLSLPDDISAVMTKIAANLNLARLSIIFGLVTSAGVIVLAVLLYSVLKTQNRTLARVGLGLWLAEAFSLAVSKIGTASLLLLSQDFVSAGSPGASFYQTLGNFLYTGIDKAGLELHMFFYCLGGLVWYYLLLKSRYVPRIIPAYGLAAVTVALAASVWGFLGYEVPIYFSIPILPFELGIGLWLVFKGIKAPVTGQLAPPVNTTA